MFNIRTRWNVFIVNRAFCNLTFFVTNFTMGFWSPAFHVCFQSQESPNALKPEHGIRQHDFIRNQFYNGIFHVCFQDQELPNALKPDHSEHGLRQNDLLRNQFYNGLLVSSISCLLSGPRVSETRWNLFIGNMAFSKMTSFVTNLTMGFWSPAFHVCFQDEESPNALQHVRREPGPQWPHLLRCQRLSAPHHLLLLQTVDFWKNRSVGEPVAPFLSFFNHFLPFLFSCPLALPPSAPPPSSVPCHWI